MKRCLAFFTSVVLVFGLLPLPAFAVSVTSATIVPEGELVEVDCPDGILQAGGLNKPAEPTSGRKGLRTQAASDEAGLEAALLAAAENWDGSASEIVVDTASFHVPVSRFRSIYSHLLNENAQLFFIPGPYSYSYNLSNEVVRVFMKVDTTFNSGHVNAFKSAANKALSGIESGWTDEQKALYLHDYLVTTCEYDLTYSNYSAYDVLVGHSAVCQGYALAYDYLLGRAGVGSNVITSEALDHAWNLVTVADKTYYVDCTWDDPSNIMVESYCGHKHFLRNKAGFVGTGHNASDWIDAWGVNVYSSSTLGVSGDYESAYWLDVLSPISHVGNLWAYVHSTWVSGVSAVNVMAHDYSTGNDVALASDLPAKWGWQAYYNCLATDGTAFYATAPNGIYRIAALENGGKTQVYSLSSAEQAAGSLYGIMRNDDAGGFTYYLATSVISELSGKGVFNPETGSSTSCDSLSDAKVTVPQQVFSGAELEPSPTVKVGANTLEEGKHYRVRSYSNNVNAGTAKVTVEGIGGYFGTATGAFTIKPMAVTPTVTLSGKSFVYTGGQIKPVPTVKVGGTTLKSGYSVSYSNNVNPGTAKVTVSFTGNYSGAASTTFSISPKATSISKLKAAKKGFTATWKKQAGGTTGYELQYSLKKSFAGAKTVKVGNTATVSKKVKKLKAKKKYFVRVRTVYNGLHSTWSAVKTVKPK